MYSFLSCKSLSLFKKRWVPFSTLSDLKDPFLFHHEVITQPQQPMSEGEFTQAVAELYDELEPHIQAMVSREYYCQQALQNREKIEAQLHSHKAKQQTPAAKHQAYYEKACMLRLFRHIEHDAIWQLHAEEHTALAVQWNVEHDFFTQAQYAGGPQLFAALEYDDARPEFPSKENPFPALLRRPEHYRYEQEWRLIRPKRIAQKKDHHRHYFSVPKEAVVAIYIGLDVPDAIRESVQQLCQYDLQFRHVKVFQMHTSDRYLRLAPQAL
ncbi:hypothetical protein [Bermanella sp. R86510]|uniref:hypothetical protein n=1 Tax=unclassified Bermanella TaxID=2627862 RepID=UPI0037C8DC68